MVTGTGASPIVADGKSRSPFHSSWRLLGEMPYQTEYPLHAVARELNRNDFDAKKQIEIETL